MKKFIENLKNILFGLVDMLWYYNYDYNIDIAINESVRQGNNFSANM